MYLLSNCTNVYTVSLNFSLTYKYYRNLTTQEATQGFGREASLIRIDAPDMGFFVIFYFKNIFYFKKHF